MQQIHAQGAQNLYKFFDVAQKLGIGKYGSKCSETSSELGDKKLMSKAEKSEQEYQRILARNSGKLFITNRQTHQCKAASPFFVQLNPNHCNFQIHYGVQNQTFLYDKSRN